MSKNNAEVRIMNGEDLRKLMEEFPNVSLRSLSLALEVNYGAILKASKTPICGAIYDPEKTNWDEIATQFAKRNANFLRDGKLDWEELNTQSLKTNINVSKSLEDFNVGDKLYIRKYPTTPFEIIYKTETHIVMLLEGTTEPISWKQTTLLLNGPTKEPRAPKVEKIEKIEK